MAFHVGVTQCTGTQYKAQCDRTLLAIPSHIREWELKSTQAVSRKWLASQGLFPWFSSMYLTWIIQRPSVCIPTTVRSKHYIPPSMQVKAALWAGCRAGLWICSKMAQKADSCFLSSVFPWIIPILFTCKAECTDVSSFETQVCAVHSSKCNLYIPLAPLM